MVTPQHRNLSLKQTLDFFTSDPKQQLATKKNILRCFQVEHISVASLNERKAQHVPKKESYIRNVLL